MNTYFEVKAKYQKIDSYGKENNVSEPYLIDAVSFTEAEERAHKELEHYISGEFFVSAVKIANYSEIIQDDNGDKWFKCKVSFITIDEEKGVEKRSNTYVLVQANDVSEAYHKLNRAYINSVSDFEIPSVNETKIVDIFTYDNDDNKE